MADSSTYTPETLQRRYAMAQALLADPKKPITHWAEGLNELAKGALGGYQMGNTERLEAKQRGDANAQVMAALGLGGQAPTAAAMPPTAGPSAAPGPVQTGPAPAAPPQVFGTGGKPLTPDAQGVYDDPNVTMLPPGAGAPSPDFGKAIAGIESAGQKDPYAALGPTTRTGDRAYGKYQVMGANIPEWTKEHLGQEMTPQQFLANPQAQDAVFKGQFGKYVQQTGNPQDAASMWFSGKPLAQGAGLKDQLGTTGQQYVDKFNAGMGGPAGASPAVGAIASALNGGASGAPTAAAGAPPSPAVADVAKTLAAPAGAPAAPLAGPAGVGANPNAKAIAAVLTSPWIDPSVKQAVIAQSSPSFGFQTLPDGTIVRTNPKTGQVEPIYQAPTKPDFGVIGKDSNGNDIHGFIDKNKQTTTPAAGAPALGSGPNSNLTGDPFLQTLDPGRANQVKAIADGRMAPPGGMSLKSPQIQGLMRDVAQYEPGFDLTSWKARNDTRADLAKGKMGQNVSSFNTAIGHLETLDKAADKLGNTWSPTYNTIKNAVSSGLGNPEVNSFNVAKTAVADELTRAFRGSGGNVHDLTQWETAINNAGSPAQLKAAIRQAVDLLHSRISAVGDQYNRGMGKTTDPLELLTPKAKSGIQRLLGEKAQDEPIGKPGASNTTKSGVTWSVE